MEAVSLLFDTDCRLLGEFFTNDGTLVRAILTEEGERSVGDAVSSWQTEGVPFHRRLEDVEYQDRISVRDPSFLDAVRQWAQAMRLSFVRVPKQAFACWQIVAQLPLEPLQRYSMLNALTSLSDGDIGEWTSALEEAATAVRAEREKTNEKIAEMWRQLARKLVSSVSKNR